MSGACFCAFFGGDGGLANTRRAFKPDVDAVKPTCPFTGTDYWGAFQTGVPKLYADPPLEEILVKSGVRLIKPNQYTTGRHS